LRQQREDPCTGICSPFLYQDQMPFKPDPNSIYEPGEGEKSQL